jgi:hypothetical protein
MYKASQSSNVESTRFATMQSLARFSPIMATALREPRSFVSVLPSFFSLLLALSDDDWEIRSLASEITSQVLCEKITFTPIAASEKLAERIGEIFDPTTLEKTLIPILLEDRIVEKLQSSVQISNTLFEKERPNVYRDEIHQWGLYIGILEGCWKCRTRMNVTPLQTTLVKEVTEFVAVLDQIIRTTDDKPLGWSREVDVFESVVKLFMLIDVMLRYLPQTELRDAFERLREFMVEAHSHPFWVERVDKLNLNLNLSET